MPPEEISPQVQSGPNIRYGVRFSLTAFMAALLLIIIIISIHTFITLGRLKEVVASIATSESGSIAAAQEIRNQIEKSRDILKEATETGDLKEQTSILAELLRQTALLQKDITTLAASRMERSGDLTLQTLDSMGKDTQKLAKALTGLQETIARLVSVSQHFMTTRQSVDKAYENCQTAIDDTMRQMRALASRALSIDIPDANTAGKLQDRLDAFLEREMSWIGTAQDLRIKAKELHALFHEISETKDQGVVDKLADRAADLTLLIRLHRRFPDTESVRRLSGATQELTRYFANSGTSSIFADRKASISLENQKRAETERSLAAFNTALINSARLTEDLERHIAKSVMQAEQDVTEAQLFLAGFMVCSIVIATIGIRLFISRRLVARVEQLTAQMLRASVETERIERTSADIGLYRVPENAPADEITAMAEALHVLVSALDFREQMIRESETALRSKERRQLREIIDLVPHFIYAKDLTGRFILANRAVAEAYGTTVEDLIGKTDTDFARNERDTGQPQIGTAGVISPALPQVIPEESFVNSSGQQLMLSSISIPFTFAETSSEGVLKVSIDITERNKSEKLLLSSQQLIEGIINAIPVRVFWKDKNLVYMGCNESFARDAGLPSTKEIIGKDDYQLGWRSQAELYRSDDRYVIGSGCSRLSIEEPQTTPEGNTITLLTSKIPLLSSNGEICGILGTYMNITDRKRVEEQIRTALAEKEILLKEVHHRVKNNMQIISSLLNLQAKKIQNPEFRIIFEEARNRIKSMSDVHEMLYNTKDFSKINCSDYINKLVKDLLLAAKLNGNEIKPIISIDDIMLGVDLAIPLGLITTELVTNALKYAFPHTGGGELTVSLTKADESFTLSIKDNGAGLPESFDYTNTDTLGLQIVSVLTKQIKGTFRISSDRGVEATIKFER